MYTNRSRAKGKGSNSVKKKSWIFSWIGLNEKEKQMMFWNFLKKWKVGQKQIGSCDKDGSA